MATAPTNRLLDIEFYINAAEEHGNNSEDAQEAGDLTQFLRAMWSLLTPEQRLQFAKHPDVQMTLEGTMVDFEEDLAELP